jgi:osmoprotectant transport system ATP-binding protein
MAALLEFRDVVYRAGATEILRGITLNVEEGETVALLGRSGSGKTTLLRAVTRLIDPVAGEVRFRGRPVSDWDVIRLRRSIGYVIQDGGLFPHLSVERNVGIVPELEGWQPERIAKRTAELLAAVSLPPSIYARRFPRELSGGEKQRVGIARALAADPPLLLLDEPFAALDPVTRYELQRQFVDLRRSFGKTAVFVTHDIREAMLVASRIALLKDGSLEVVAEPQEFLSAATPEARAFLATLAEDRRLDESHAHG